MANPRYGNVAQSRGTDSKPGKGKPKGFSASVVVKQSFTSGQLPGKASNGFKRTVTYVESKASSKGLC